MFFLVASDLLSWCCTRPLGLQNKRYVGGTYMKTIVVFVIAAIVAGGYFYFLDHLLMGAQGLPIGIDLMPVVK